MDDVTPRQRRPNSPPPTATKRGVARTNMKSAGSPRASAPSKAATAGDETPDYSYSSDLPLRRILPSAYVVLALAAVTQAVGVKDLSEDILTASIRTFVQLSCLGAILSPLFRCRSATPVLGYVLCLMLPMAAYEASARPALTYPTARRNVLIGLGLAVASTTAVALFGVLRPNPRLGARHLIPLAGMLLSNSLSSAALALDRLLDELGGGAGAVRVELMLALGATPWEATRPAAADVLRRAMVPTLNSMNVIGLVAIPGMMTGQILGGASPVRAARYQIVIMFLIAGATGLVAGVTCLLTVRDAFDARGVFLAETITPQSSARISQLFASPAKSRLGPSASADALDSVSAVSGVVLHAEWPPPPTAEAAVGDGNEFKDAEAHFALDVWGTMPAVRGGEQLRRTFRAALSLRPGDVACVLGPSGIGKSTLLKSIAELSGAGALREEGASPSSSSSLSIALRGRDRRTYAAHEWRRRVVYVPQSRTASLPGTPRSLIEEVRRLGGHADRGPGGRRPPDAEAVGALLSRWGLPPAPTLDRPWSDLSGGEAQRALLAIAISTRPRVLLLDEPTSALDEESKRLVEETLRNGLDWGCAVVLVTHDEEQARRVGTSRWRLDKED